MKIREATFEDAEVISLLARVTFDETFGHLFKDRQDLLDYFDRTFSVQKLRNSIASKNNKFWLAFVNELPVGYAKLKVHSLSEFILQKERVSQLQKIYVLKDFLSKKIGFQLQETLLSKAKELNSKIIWLSVLHTNERAINFYLKNGFSSVGKHIFSIGKEDFEFVAMGKPL
ncbi:ribosomal protein S18 acetylase RimI-like enzyme [Tenacibaculum adriaticum]|uniref:Ribosomal protein S18 acetylase RimI-like enzyme n=1 Tax=Tenacibaculum adriaticum TaxID=413713 RepID=A0A5S5DQC2_9FLAO|nr:GNAT family N-acetyltransferase [Tenacibaculum adriaticum]TYP98091.1 ribosomal protein S18 acetylase RimI-like enzyme [Tenacibaculum adriaticum]